MENENIEIPEHEIEGLLQTLKELVIKGLWNGVMFWGKVFT